MKKLKWIIFGLMLAGLAGLAFSACGGGGESCSESADCSGSKVCWKGSGSGTQGQCVKSCNNDPNVCGNQSSCETIEGGAKGCVPKGTSDAGPDATDATNGGDGMTSGCSEGSCSAGKFCWNGEKCINEYKFVHLRDATRDETPSSQDEDDNGTPDEEDICDTSNDNITTGADIFGVELVDSEGQTLAWGTTVNYDSTTNRTSRKKFDQILDGSKPSLENTGDASTACPSGDFGGDTIAALGCGGAAIVGFKNDSGNWMSLKPGHTIRVYEYGTNCLNIPDDPDKCNNVCNPKCNYALCGREYVQISSCPSDKPASELQSLSRSGDNFDGCGTSDLTLGTGEGFASVGAAPLWPDIE